METLMDLYNSVESPLDDIDIIKNRYNKKMYRVVFRNSKIWWKFL